MRKVGKAGAKKLGDGKWGPIIFGSIFVLFGSVFAYIVLIRPLVQVTKARSWERAQAVVTHSEVDSHSDSDGTTYSVDIAYSYEVMEQTYSGNRYDFICELPTFLT